MSINPKKTVSSFKEEVNSQVEDLATLLYGTIGDKWKKRAFSRFGYHARHIIKILVKGRPNPFIIKNTIKAFGQVGIDNLNTMLTQQIRLIDEMSYINQIHKKKGWKPDTEFKKKKAPLYSIPDPKEPEGMTSYERFNRAIDLKEPDRIPITPLMDYFYAANNQMSPREFVLGPFENVSNAVKNTYNRFKGVLDMVHCPMGRLYAFYNMLPLGPSGYFSELIYPDNVPNSLQFIEKGYINVKDFKKIKKYGLRSIWRPVPIEKIHDVQCDLIKIGRYIDYWENERNVPIYATSGIVTPLEGICYLMGINNFSRAIRKNVEELKELCDLFLKGTLASSFMMFMLTQIKRTYVCLERVSATFISPKIFEELVLENLLAMVKQNVRHGLTTVFHMDTDWTPFFHYFLEFPKNGKYILHLEDSDIYKAKEMLGDRFCIMGNIQTKLLRFGTKQQIIDKTKELIEVCKEGGGYMMAEGCEIAPDTPMSNMNAWIDTTLKYGKY